MSNYQVLQPDIHTNLSIEPSLRYANALHQFAPICLAEVPQIAVEYPIFIAKHPTTGQFALQAMLGLDAHENLFLNNGQWNSSYVPLHFATQPFRLVIDQNNLNNAQISIDVEHTCITNGTEQRLFTQDKQHTEFLSKNISILRQMLSSIQHNQTFFSTLLEYDLLERIQLNINADIANNLAQAAMYSINEKALNQLTSEQVTTLHQTGYLPACYLILASKLKVQSLINLKQNRLNEVPNA